MQTGGSGCSFQHGMWARTAAGQRSYAWLRRTLGFRSMLGIGCEQAQCRSPGCHRLRAVAYSAAKQKDLCPAWSCVFLPSAHRAVATSSLACASCGGKSDLVGRQCASRDQLRHRGHGGLCPGSCLSSCLGSLPTGRFGESRGPLPHPCCGARGQRRVSLGFLQGTQAAACWGLVAQGCGLLVSALSPRDWAPGVLGTEAVSMGLVEVGALPWLCPHVLYRACLCLLPDQVHHPSSHPRGRPCPLQTAWCGRNFDLESCASHVLPCHPLSVPQPTVQPSPVP